MTDKQKIQNLIRAVNIILEELSQTHPQIAIRMRKEKEDKSDG